jgi:hypothetical protein
VVEEPGPLTTAPAETTVAPLDTAPPFDAGVVPPPTSDPVPTVGTPKNPPTGASPTDAGTQAPSIPTFVLPSALPSTLPALPSGFPTSIPTAFPTTLPPLFPGAAEQPDGG